MALTDEGKMQGNLENILFTLRQQAACCDEVAAVIWATSSVVGGPVFISISRGGDITVFSQPGGAVLTQAQYGTLTPA